MTTAFVLGGGGVLGAVEVGMLRALFERDITPDLVLGTSVGALNGAMVARDPSLAVIDRLTELWRGAGEAARGVRRPAAAHGAPGGVDRHPPLLRQAAAAAAGGRVRRHHLRGAAGAVPGVRRAASSGPPSTGSTPVRWSTRSSPAPPYPACCRRPRSATSTTSTAASSTRSRSAGPSQLGATRVFVLQVGRIDRPLTPPRRPWEVARVSFEIARRHRFAREMAELPDGVEAHVLPARGTSARDDSLLRPPRLRRRPGADRRDVRRLPWTTSTSPREPGRVRPASSWRPRSWPASRAPASWVTLPAVADRGGRAVPAAARAAGGRCACSGW